MKIQFHEQNSFQIEGKNNKVLLDPVTENLNEVDLVLHSGGNNNIKNNAKKALILPGEFEISNILVKGFYTENKQNIVYKFTLDEITCAAFGGLEEVPNTKLLENLGENIDIAFINLSESFNDKKAKDLIEKTEPRMVILGGDSAYFAKMTENSGAKTAEENPLKIKKSELSAEKTEILILPV